MPPKGKPGKPRQIISDWVDVDDDGSTGSHVVDKIGIRKRLAKSSQMFKRRLFWLACNITSPVNVNHMRSERATMTISG